jgi:hypothetical protein
MRLIEFSISNYRSIRRQTKLTPGNFTTLIGPNNEGKTNTLRALTIAFAVIHKWKNLNIQKNEISGPQASSFLTNLRTDSATGLVYDYIYDRDYPKTGRSTRATTIRLSFELTQEEVLAFQNETGLRNDQHIPLTIKITKSKVELTINKQGQGNKTYNSRISTITKFIDERIGLLSIPAIRSSSQMLKVAQELSQKHLNEELEQNEEYTELRRRMSEIQNEQLATLSHSITTQIKRYAQNVNSIRLRPRDEHANTPLIDGIEIEDPVNTSSTEKGEGLQSLIAIGLIQEATKTIGNHRTYLLVIDEPEAHLHPSAVRVLKQTLDEIAISQQVLVATHSPIFIGRQTDHHNVLIENNNANARPSLRQIRKCMGMMVGDSLLSAEVSVLVEGSTDEQIYNKLLAEASQAIQTALSSSKLCIVSTSGTIYLSQHIRTQKDYLSHVVVLCDGDKSANQALNQCIDEGLIDKASTFSIPPIHRRKDAEVEIEDIFTDEFITDALNDKFGKRFSVDDFKSRDRKWSERFSSAALTCGASIPLSDAKTCIASSVLKEGLSAVRPEYRVYITRICAYLESVLSNLPTA